MKVSTFHIKNLDGNIIKINCDPFQLKKEILRIEQQLPVECTLLFDVERKKVLSQIDLLQATRSGQGQQIITLYDSRKIIQELDAEKKNRHISDQNVQTLKNDKEKLLKQVAQLEKKVEQQAKENQEYMQKGQESSDILTNLNKKLNEQKKEHDAKVHQMNQEKLQSDQLYASQIQGLEEYIQQMRITIENNEKQINIWVTKNQEQENKNNQLNGQIELQTQQHNIVLSQAHQHIEQLNQYYQQQQQQLQVQFVEQQQNAQASLNALTQEKEALAQKGKKDGEEFSRKYRQLKTEKEEQDEILNKLNKDLSANKAQLAEALKKLANSNQQVKKLEEEIEELTRGKTNESQIIQMRDKEIRKLKQDIVQLNQNLQSEQDQNDIQRNQYINLQKEKQVMSDKLNEEINKLNENITELSATIISKSTQIDGLQKQVATLSIQLKNSQEEQKNLQKQLVDLKIEIQDQASKGDGANTALKDVKLQLSARNKEVEQLNENLDQAQKKQQTLSLENTNLNGKLKSLQLQYDALQNDYKEAKLSLQEHTETNRKMLEDFTKQIQDDQQKYKADIEYKDIIVKKICTNQQDKYIDKIIGPMEKIMNSEFKINKFAEDPNSQRDNTEYIVHEISFDKIKAQNLMKEQKWMCFDECLLYQTLGTAKTIRSIQPNADVTLLKGYIIQIEEIDNGGLKDKKLLRKEYKSQATPMLITKEEAGKLSLNNMLCKFLLDKYNSMYGFPKIQGKQIQIQRQFVLQVKGKEEYCYCENIVEEQPFEKINGGTFQVKDTELHQYLNAFSLYTYHMMNRQLIITNLQVVGQYLHDMIVSTQFKIFTPIDQGSSEIAQTLGIIEKAPQAALSKYWNEKIEQQAKQGWK